MQDALATLTDAVRSTQADQILIVTGAGVSHASGIPTFRGSDPDAIWKRDVTELGTHAFFCEDPAGSWQWYLSRFENLEGKKPNPGHHAIVALERFQIERGGEFLLITQNIDTLHEQAGSRRMIKVHGTSDRYRCSRVGCELGAPEGSIAASEVDLTAFRANPVEANVPRCPSCGSFLRMHVLWFDETYAGHHDYHWRRVGFAAQVQAQLVIFAGTSFSVGVTDLVTKLALRRHVPVFNIDPTPRVHERGIMSIAAGAEVALVEVCKRLGVAVGAGTA
ncbi:Sir2 family NAD-dependent protein deacetylase [Polyangium sp. 15x6]|uniref:SIR2 family NAD-dependent protein deacylase n=1 Tax=Polyangium sp. 15x6 TaxID=3042687 RepID=UPI00249CD3A2|nr:Sir2 family NAD-dependent protein deacetylase [Polyangium sp. 15x6]MDI3282583.1 Sir2 family NAD-dependent protein deacetylase [Polyangium sp. 15x6]